MSDSIKLQVLVFVLLSCLFGGLFLIDKIMWKLFDLVFGFITGVVSEIIERVFMCLILSVIGISVILFGTETTFDVIEKIVPEKFKK